MDWNTIISIISGIALPMTIWVLSYSHRKLEDQKKEAAERERVNFKRYQELQKCHERLTLDLHNFQLNVAQSYATMMALREAEQRFASAVERFETKLDQFMAAIVAKAEHLR